MDGYIWTSKHDWIARNIMGFLLYLGALFLITGATLVQEHDGTRVIM